MKLFAPFFAIMAFLPALSFANLQFETLKSSDGKAQHCQTRADLDKTAYFLENTLVQNSRKKANTLEFTIAPAFYICQQSANGYDWQPSTMEAFLSRSVQTEEGTVNIVPVSYAWVVYSENYTELNPQPSLTRTNTLSYSVSIDNLLNTDEQSRRRRGQSARGIVTVFLKSVVKAIYPDGREELLGSQASGSFNIVITLPSR